MSQQEDTTPEKKNNRTALVIGASGLVGGHCLDYLLQEESYSKVIALLRKPLAINHPKLEQQVIEFDRLENYRSIIRGDDIYCCIGTTFLKSPKKSDYYKIDFIYPNEIAKIVKEKGAEQFSLISALSANKEAPFFYSRVKGELENAILDLKFSSTYIFRPSFLVGERQEFRPIEIIGVSVLKILTPLLQGGLRQYRPIEASAVAKVMVAISTQHKPGNHLFLNDEIQAIYDKL